jgi:hypothetical protein
VSSGHNAPSENTVPSQNSMYTTPPQGYPVSNGYAGSRQPYTPMEYRVSPGFRASSGPVRPPASLVNPTGYRPPDTYGEATVPWNTESF